MKLHASWLVCANICVPEQGDFQLNIATGAAAPSPQAPLFAAADARMPRPSPWSARIAPDGVLSVDGPGISAAAVKDAWVLPLDWGWVEPSAAQKLTVRDGGFTLGLTRASAFKPGDGIAGRVGGA